MSDQPKQLIVLTDDGWKPAIHSEAQKQKDEVLKLGKTVLDVLDKDSKEEAVHVAGSIKGLIAACEKARKAAVEPLNLEHDKIQEISKKFKKELEAEAIRIEKLISDYVAEEHAKAEAERKRLWQEQENARIARETAERQQREAEEARKRADEAKGRAAKAEAERIAREAEELARASQQVAAQATVDVAETHRPVVSDTKAQGATVKPRLVPRVVDIHALYRWRPDCVNLSPNLIYLNGLIASGITEIPGVELTPEIKVSVRAHRNDLQLQ